MLGIKQNTLYSSQKLVELRKHFLPKHTYFAYKEDYIYSSWFQGYFWSAWAKNPNYLKNQNRKS